MNIFVIVRHGHVENPINEKGQRLTYGPEDGLSDVGKIQIGAVARDLIRAGIQMDKLVSSPYKRAIQSAEILGSTFGVPIITDKRLMDVHAPGWVGTSVEELSDLGGNIYSLPPRSDDQESLENLIARSKEVIDSLNEENEGKVIGVVSHGDIISAMNWVVTREGMPSSYPEMSKHFYLDKGQAFVCALEEGKMIGEGRRFTSEYADSTREGFRGMTHRK